MDFVDIGYVARPHGIRGDLRVVLYNPESALLAEVRSVRIGAELYEIATARAVQGAFLLHLVDLDDRNEAELLRGQVVSVPRSLIPLDDGEVLLADLLGCEAVLPDGSSYGTIEAVEPGAQDRLVIRQGDIERLLPLVPEFVGAVDLAAGRVVVTPPEGLPEAPAAQASVAQRRAVARPDNEATKGKPRGARNAGKRRGR
jgi:16S rRNA processing protein RimM